MSMAEAAGDAADAALDDLASALRLLALDPVGFGGLRLRLRPGPLRDATVAALARLFAPAPIRRLPLNVEDDRLLGGLDLPSTLSLGRPVMRDGLLAEADGGLTVAPMAERIEAGAAARIAQVLDAGAVRAARGGDLPAHSARFALILLDEGVEPGEAPPPHLTDRVAFHIDGGVLEARRPSLAALETLAGPSQAQRIAFRTAALSADLVEAAVAAAAALGVQGDRAALFAARAAWGLAALDGRSTAGEADAAAAVRLVLAPRARRAPTAPEEMIEEPVDEMEEVEPRPETVGDVDPGEGKEADRASAGAPEGGEASGPARTPSLEEVMVAAAAAALPPGALTGLEGRLRGGGGAGSAGASGVGRRCGRPVGVRRGALDGGAKLDLLATLKAAAPWSKIRRLPVVDSDAAGKVAGDGAGFRAPPIRRDDLRVKRYKPTRRGLTLFVVDASGSAAAARLAEAKGAVELLLADLYRRRDEVALIVFRGAGAEVVLPPTRSLVRAKRALAAAPGGGATPLAAAVEAATAQSDRARRAGFAPLAVFLTDGRANVALDGGGGRDRADADALAAAARFRAAGAPALVIDSAPRPEPKARRFAEALGARYLALPRANAQSVAAAAIDAATGRAPAQLEARRR